MKTEFKPSQPYTKNVSFKALGNIDKTAMKIAGTAINDAKDILIKQSKDVDVEIIGKNGVLSQVKSVIVFVANKGEQTGEWESISIDPKGYMPTGFRYKTVKQFSANEIVEGFTRAKQRLKKLNMQLDKPSLPVDAILLKTISEKIQDIKIWIDTHIR